MSITKPFDVLAATLLSAAVFAACSAPASTDQTTPPTSAPVAASPAHSAPVVADALAGWSEVESQFGGDAAHGKALVARYECNRCHAGTEELPPSFDRQCVRCHQAIVAETLPFPKAKLEAWHAATHHYITTPSLATIGQTLRPSWVASFLHEPVKIRPHEEEWMPRLKISESDARDLAAYLAREATPPTEVVPTGDVARGAAVVAKKGCFICHDFTGVARADVPVEMPQFDAEKLTRGITQAPNLRLARERFRPDLIVKWILDPTSVRAGAEMPTLGLTLEEARDAAAYILRAPLAAPPPPPPPFVRLPVLERHVRYEEVADRVFRKSCTHCHADPSPNGDPGPGSTGGFGFAPRGIALLSFGGTQKGYLGDDHARHSLFATEPALVKLTGDSGSGGSRLVAALVARHEETSGRPVAEVRGMPMGLPGLSAEEIQLVETWVAQGARKE